jgi:hypothetical protein
MMKNILPEGSDGIVLVVDNACTPSFTYQINGPRVQFLGGGDLHDKSYDDLEMASDLLDLRQVAIKDSEYTGTPIADSYCQYYVRAYPSDVLKDKYTTRKGIIFAVCALLIFGLTSAFFQLYDYCVERRQKIVYSSAVRSKAIVSSLFPTNVRDRMERIAERKTSDDLRKGGGVGAQSTNDDAPIADLFQNTTIFFADIA